MPSCLILEYRHCQITVNSVTFRAYLYKPFKWSYGYIYTLGKFEWQKDYGERKGKHYFRKIIEKKSNGAEIQGGAFKGSRGGVLGGGALIKGAHLELGR